MYIYTHTHTHIYIYTCIYIYVCVYTHVTSIKIYQSKYMNDCEKGLYHPYIIYHNVSINIVFDYAILLRNTTRKRKVYKIIIPTDL